MWQYLIQIITAVAAIAGLIFAYLNYRMLHPKISIHIREDSHYEIVNDGRITVIIRAIFLIDNNSRTPTSLKSITCGLFVHPNGSLVTIPPSQGRFPITIGDKPTMLLEHSFAFDRDSIKDFSDIQICEKDQNSLKILFSFETKEKMLPVDYCVKPKDSSPSFH